MTAVPTCGGDGGALLTVTSLADSGPGSLREALATEGPRVVRFAVAGDVLLETPLRDVKPYLTLEGASAPGVVRLRRSPLHLQATHDIKIQHLRIRRGDTPFVPGDDGDCLTVSAGTHHVWIDHASLSWSMDGLLDISVSGCHHIVVSNCLLAEALYQTVNRPDGRAHSTGLMVGYGASDVLLYNNLFAHIGDRVPYVANSDRVMVVNNIVYNTIKSLPKTGIDDGVERYILFAGNWNRSGPSTDTNSNCSARYCVLMSSENVHGYLRDNRCDRRLVNTLPEEAAVHYASIGVIEAAPFDFPPVLVRAPEDALTHVLAQAGATLPVRDATDTRVVADVQNGTGAILNAPPEGE